MPEWKGEVGRATRIQQIPTLLAGKSLVHVADLHSQLH